jgi:hypothetical protein
LGYDLVFCAAKNSDFRAIFPFPFSTAYFNPAKARIEMTARGRGPNPLHSNFRERPLDPGGGMIA